MNAPEAREQLDVVDRVLAYAQEPADTGGFPLVVWGIAAAIINIVLQLIVTRALPNGFWLVGAAALVSAITLTLLWIRREVRSAERQTLIGRQMAIAFNIAWIAALVAQVGAFRIFSDWAQAAIWSVMYGAMLLFAGATVRNRVVLAGGIVLLLSVIAANLVLRSAGFVLALGDLVGMAGAGVLLYAGRK